MLACELCDALLEPGGAASRSRTPSRDLESILQYAAEAQGWRATRQKRYFMLWCPCPDKHYKTVKLTPSNPNYERELRSRLKTHTCWEKPS